MKFPFSALIQLKCKQFIVAHLIVVPDECRYVVRPTLLDPSSKPINMLSVMRSVLVRK